MSAVRSKPKPFIAANGFIGDFPTEVFGHSSSAGPLCGGGTHMARGDIYDAMGEFQEALTPHVAVAVYFRTPGRTQSKKTAILYL